MLTALLPFHVALQGQPGAGDGASWTLDRHVADHRMGAALIDRADRGAHFRRDQCAAG